MNKKSRNRIRAVISILEGREPAEYQDLMPGLARAISILVGARVVRPILCDWQP